MYEMHGFPDESYISYHLCGFISESITCYLGKSPSVISMEQYDVCCLQIAYWAFILLRMIMKILLL